ncbi:hypothetical protein M5689_009318 [Euphorbia peplus]|nr:hypothetical protein M5689_009318 [Euphorbia peplus]
MGDVLMTTVIPCNCTKYVPRNGTRDSSFVLVSRRGDKRGKVANLIHNLFLISIIEVVSKSLFNVTDHLTFRNELDQPDTLNLGKNPNLSKHNHIDIVHNQSLHKCSSPIEMLQPPSTPEAHICDVPFCA